MKGMKLRSACVCVQRQIRTHSRFHHRFDPSWVSNPPQRRTQKVSMNLLADAPTKIDWTADFIGHSFWHPLGFGEQNLWSCQGATCICIVRPGSLANWIGLCKLPKSGTTCLDKNKKNCFWKRLHDENNFSYCSEPFLYEQWIKLHHFNTSILLLMECL